MDLKEKEQHFEGDVEATEDELRGVAYTAISFVSFIVVIIGSVVVAFL